jgi:hypothetical protein
MRSRWLACRLNTEPSSSEAGEWWDRHLDKHGAMREALKFLIGKSEGKRLLEDLDVDVRVY